MLLRKNIYHFSRCSKGIIRRADISSISHFLDITVDAKCSNVNIYSFNRVGIAQSVERSSAV